MVSYLSRKGWKYLRRIPEDRLSWPVPPALLENAFELIVVLLLFIDEIRRIVARRRFLSGLAHNQRRTRLVVSEHSRAGIAIKEKYWFLKRFYLCEVGRHVGFKHLVFDNRPGPL